jgi:DNA topoisomerase I
MAEQEKSRSRARRMQLKSRLTPFLQRQTGGFGDPPTLEPVIAAEVAQLRYINDRLPGITRLPASDGFIYRDPGGRMIRSESELARFKALRIPPASTDVWICPDPGGHIQAVGRDKRGRKQMNHLRWRAVRDETKFEHMLTSGARCHA